MIKFVRNGSFKGMKIKEYLARIETFMNLFQGGVGLGNSSRREAIQRQGYITRPLGHSPHL